MKKIKKLFCVFFACATFLLTFAPESINAASSEGLDFSDYNIYAYGNCVKVEGGYVYYKTKTGWYELSDSKVGRWTAEEQSSKTVDKSKYQGNTITEYEIETKTQYQYKIQTVTYKKGIRYVVAFNPKSAAKRAGKKAYTEIYYSKNWDVPSGYTCACVEEEYTSTSYSYYNTKWSDSPMSNAERSQKRVTNEYTRTMYRCTTKKYKWTTDISWKSTGKKAKFKMESDAILHWSFVLQFSSNQDLGDDKDYAGRYVTKIEEYYVSSSAILDEINKKVQAVKIDEDEIKKMIVGMIGDVLKDAAYNKVIGYLKKLKVENAGKTLHKVEEIFNGAVDCIQAENLAKELIFYVLRKIPGVGVAIDLFAISECCITNKNVEEISSTIKKCIDSGDVFAYQVVTFLSGPKSVRVVSVPKSEIKKVSVLALEHSWFKYETFKTTGTYVGNIDYISSKKASTVYKLMLGECEVKTFRN